MEIVIGVLGLIIALLGWRISFLQNKMTEKESRFKDFDRNFAAHQKLEKYIIKIIGGRINLNDTIQFDEEIKDFQYVFSKDINDFSQIVRSFGIDLAILNDKISLLSNSEITKDEFDERKKLMSEKSELIKKAFIELSSELTFIFKPILLINK